MLLCHHNHTLSCYKACLTAYGGRNMETIASNFLQNFYLFYRNSIRHSLNNFGRLCKENKKTYVH